MDAVCASVLVQMDYDNNIFFFRKTAMQTTAIQPGKKQKAYSQIRFCRQYDIAESVSVQ